MLPALLPETSAPDTGEITASQLAYYNSLLDDTTSAVASGNADTIKAAGQANYAFLQRYESQFIAAGHQDYIDQMNAAQDQLRTALQGGTYGSTQGPASVSGAFLGEVGQSVSDSVDKVSNGFATLVGKAGEEAKALAESIRPVVYILAVAVGIAIIVGVYFFVEKF